MSLFLHVHFYFYKINLIYALKHRTHSMNATPPSYFCPNPTTAENRNRAPPISDSRSVFNVQNWSQTDTVLSWSTELVSCKCCYAISLRPVYPGCMRVVFSAVSGCQNVLLYNSRLLEQRFNEIQSTIDERWTVSLKYGRNQSEPWSWTQT